MDLNKVNDIITGIFAPDMSDVAEYWKDFLFIVVLFLSIHAHCGTNTFQDLIDSQRATIPWFTIYDNNQYSRWLPYFLVSACKSPKVSREFSRRKLCTFLDWQSVFWNVFRQDNRSNND